MSYLAENEETLHKFNISSAEAIKKIKDEKSGDHRTLANFFWTSLVLAILVVVLLCVLDSQMGKNWGKYDIAYSMIWLTWGLISAAFASSLVNQNVKGHIYKRLETCRCPHCNAPLSYFETNVYTDGEVYFVKRVSKYNSELRMYVNVNENWMKYKEHHIFTCDYCRQKDDKVQEKEERLDKPTLGSVLGHFSNLDAR